MPLYDFKCSVGHKFERHVPLAKFEERQYCACGAGAKRAISKPMISVERVEYTCPITGTPILSKRAHEENLRKHGCVVAETGLEEEINSRREAENKKLDKLVDDHVDKTWENMDSESRESLAKDIISGAEVTLERT